MIGPPPPAVSAALRTPLCHRRKHRTAVTLNVRSRRIEEWAHCSIKPSLIPAMRLRVLAARFSFALLVRSFAPQPPGAFADLSRQRTHEKSTAPIALRPR